MLWASLKMVPPICVRKPGKMRRPVAGSPRESTVFAGIHPPIRHKNQYRATIDNSNESASGSLRSSVSAEEDGKELWSPYLVLLLGKKRKCGNMWQEPQYSTNLLQFYFFIFLHISSYLFIIQCHHIAEISSELGMSRDGLMKFNASLTHLHFEMLDSLQAFKGDIAPVP